MNVYLRPKGLLIYLKYEVHYVPKTSKITDISQSSQNIKHILMNGVGRLL